jgi:hypothetical protein
VKWLGLTSPKAANKTCLTDAFATNIRLEIFYCEPGLTDSEGQPEDLAVKPLEACWIVRYYFMASFTVNFKSIAGLPQKSFD